MIIKHINWLSKDSLEAEVLVTDGEFELLCFSHPMNYKESQEITTPLMVLDVFNVIRSDTLLPSVEKMSGAFEYYLTGKLVNKRKGIVELGEIKIEIGNSFLPQDINQDEFISFQCNRLDI